ncbi:hypothetical protein RYX36_008625 [Vicia faba]
MHLLIFRFCLSSSSRNNNNNTLKQKTNIRIQFLISNCFNFGFAVLFELQGYVRCSRRYVDAILTIPKGSLFPICGMNLVFDRELIGPAMYFNLMGDGNYIVWAEQPKEKAPTMSSAAMPYTGGDIKRSGELGKMFDIPMDGSKSRKSGPLNNAPIRTGSFGGAVCTPDRLCKMRLLDMLMSHQGIYLLPRMDNF